MEMSYGGFSFPFAVFVDFRCQHGVRKRGFGDLSDATISVCKDNQDRGVNFFR